ncbi:MAG: nitrophenyl compound nitroreductase subunit ArsF family protein [Bacteroidota bacterium]
MKVTNLLALIVLLGIGLSCSANANKEKNESEEIKQAETVEVYYFHNKRRCATCKTVEKVSKEAVEELDNDKVSFKAINIEESEGKEKAEELGISGQTLLISGGDEKMNITREGFLYARQPEKLKKLIHEKINSVL